MLTYNYLKDVPGPTVDIFVFLPFSLPSGSISPDLEKQELSFLAGR